MDQSEYIRIVKETRDYLTRGMLDARSCLQNTHRDMLEFYSAVLQVYGQTRSKLESRLERIPGMYEQFPLMTQKAIDLDLSVRARKAFCVLGLETVDDITCARERDFRNVPNCGKGTIEEIKAKLSEMGLKLKE